MHTHQVSPHEDQYYSSKLRDAETNEGDAKKKKEEEEEKKKGVNHRELASLVKQVRESTATTLSLSLTHTHTHTHTH